MLPLGTASRNLPPLLALSQGVDGDLPGTVEPGSDPAGANPAAGVAVCHAELPTPPNRPPWAPRVGDDRVPSRKAQLPAMGVSAEHQVGADQFGGMVDLRTMRQEDCAAFLGDCANTLH